MHQFQGLTLIEILFSFVLLSLILLASDALEVSALRTAIEGYYYHIANQQLIEISERLRATASVAGTEGQIQIWNHHNQMLLPEAQGKVVGYYPRYIISLRWGKMKQQKCENKYQGRSGCLQAIIQF